MACAHERVGVGGTGGGGGAVETQIGCYAGLLLELMFPLPPGFLPFPS